MNPRLRALAQRVVASSFARSGMFVFAAVILGNAVNYAYLLLLGRLLLRSCASGSDCGLRRPASRRLLLLLLLPLLLGRLLLR